MFQLKSNTPAPLHTHTNTNTHPLTHTHTHARTHAPHQKCIILGLHSHTPPLHPPLHPPGPLPPPHVGSAYFRRAHTLQGSLLSARAGLAFDASQTNPRVEHHTASSGFFLRMAIAFLFSSIFGLRWWSVGWFVREGITEIFD